MQRDQGMPVVGYLMFTVFVPFALSFMASLAAFASACIALVVRVLYFLKSGYWVHSACDASSYLTWYGINSPTLAISFLSRARGELELSAQSGAQSFGREPLCLARGYGALIVGALGMRGFTALAQKLP